MSAPFFVVRYSPWRTVLGIAGCAGFAAIGLWLAGAIGYIGTPLPVIGYGAAAIFAVIMAIGARRLGWSGPAFKIDGLGIHHWFGRQGGFVPWTAVRRIEERIVHRQHFICLWPDTPERWVKWRPGAKRFGHLSLGTGGTDGHFAELRAAVRRHAPARLTSLDYLR